MVISSILHKESPSLVFVFNPVSISFYNHFMLHAKCTSKCHSKFELIEIKVGKSALGLIHPLKS